MIVVIPVIFNHDSTCDHFCVSYIHAGPDAVQFIVNHATVEVIFCVPQTLSTVRFDTLSLPWKLPSPTIYKYLCCMSPLIPVLTRDV
jgi:hypothetical protein